MRKFKYSNKITELAEGSGIKTEREGGLINHNFRTLIIDPSGHLQTVFPMGGDLSDAIVQEIRKAMAVRNADNAHFLDYGNAEEYHARLEKVRRAFGDLKE